MGKRVKFMLKLILKLSLASALIYWLISTGKLDFADLGVLLHNPRILAYNSFFWMTGAVFLCAMRWRFLVLGLGFVLSGFQALRLNMIGLFFNTVMPGVVGGDVVKAIYVCKGQPGKARVPVLLSILLDRVMGLLGLFFISFVAILLNWSIVIENALMRPFVLLTFSVVAGVGGLVFMAVLPAQTREKFFLIRWIYRVINRIRFLRKIYDALRSYKDKPQFLLRAFGLGVLHQLMLVGLYITVTRVLLPQDLHWGVLLTILPIGIVTTALPLTPGGLGVGHIAFDRLYQLVGVSSGGANVFNVVFFGQMSLNLLGFIPYLFLRSELAPLIDSAREQDQSRA